MLRQQHPRHDQIQRWIPQPSGGEVDHRTETAVPSEDVSRASCPHVSKYPDRPRGQLHRAVPDRPGGMGANQAMYLLDSSKGELMLVGQRPPR
jgi:hypothetical protein